MQWLSDMFALIPNEHQERSTIIVMLTLSGICIVYACIHTLLACTRALLFNRPVSSTSALIPAYFAAAASIIGYFAFHYILLTIEL